MLIQEIPQSEEFNLKYIEIAGKRAVLVCPVHNGVHWTKDNLIFRSSGWIEHNGCYELISAGFPKFFNLGEHPELVRDPNDADLRDGVLTEKIDGSLLIVSCYKGQIIARTRGTWDARTLDNGDEIDYFMVKYPRVFEVGEGYTSEMSFLYEWYSPRNRIVLDYGDEPQLFLVGSVKHSDYSLFNQVTLDGMAIYTGVQRPRYYSFRTMNDTVEAVKSFKGAEGVCVYFNDGQDIKKIKGVEYLAMHAMKSNMSPKYILDYLFEHTEIQTADDFCRSADLDFELISNYNRMINDTIVLRENFMQGLVRLKLGVDKITTKYSTRKEQAQAIQYIFPKQLWGYAFLSLDNKPFPVQRMKDSILEIIDTLESTVEL